MRMIEDGIGSCVDFLSDKSYILSIWYYIEGMFYLFN